MPKSNKGGITIYDEGKLPEIIEWLTAHHFAAIISPIHDSDFWTKADVFKLITSINQRYGLKVQFGDESYGRPLKTYKMVCGRRVYDTEVVALPCVGDPKKAHRHLYFRLDYSCPMQVLLDYFADNGAPFQVYYIEPIRSERAYIRYMVHMDNPEKAQYKAKDVISLGGLDLQPLYDETRQDKTANFQGLYDYIRGHDRILSCRQLVKALMDDGLRDYAMEVRAHSYFWTSQLNQKGYKALPNACSDES